jgi:hypothetical protein
MGIDLSKTISAQSSMWDALHDADLVEIETDSMARRLSILLDVSHLRAFAKLRDDVRWRLIVDDATVLLARTWEPWPGSVPKEKELSREQERAVVAKYQAKGRTVSLGWNDFEVATNTNGIWLKAANLREEDSGVVLSGHGHDKKTDSFVEFEVAGKALRCERTDVGPLPLAELLSLGEAYWKEFANRRLDGPTDPM